MSERDYLVTTSLIVTASSPLDAAKQFANHLSESGTPRSAAYTVQSAAEEIGEVIDLDQYPDDDEEPVHYGFARSYDLDTLDEVFTIRKR